MVRTGRGGGGDLAGSGGGGDFTASNLGALVSLLSAPAELEGTEAVALSANGEEACSGRCFLAQLENWAWQALQKAREGAPLFSP